MAQVRARTTGLPFAQVEDHLQSVIDAKNREVLTYLPGVVARRPLPAFATADSTLAALGPLQLRYHEAVAGFEPAPGARWDGEVTRFVDGPVDIICHCDINLENLIFQPGPDGLRPYALIDFDLARMVSCPCRVRPRAPP